MTHVAIEVQIPDEFVLALDASTLPVGWRAYPAPAVLAAFGDQWVESGESAVLSVPSAVVPEERNYLIHPGHDDFRRIKTLAPVRVTYHPRLFG